MHDCTAGARWRAKFSTELRALSPPLRLAATDFVPSEEEPDKQAEDVWHSDNDESDDELDLSKPKAEPERQSKRAKCERHRDIGSYMLNSSQIVHFW